MNIEQIAEICQGTWPMVRSPTGLLLIATNANVAMSWVTWFSFTRQFSSINRSILNIFICIRGIPSPHSKLQTHVPFCVAHDDKIIDCDF